MTTKNGTDHSTRYAEASDLPEFAKMARLAAGLTQAEAAERLGVQQASVRAAENDRTGRYVKLQCQMIGELGGACAGPVWRVTHAGLTEREIVGRINALGFKVQKDESGQDKMQWTYRGVSIRRYNRGESGSSLYVGSNVLSALGEYRSLAADVSPTEYRSNKSRPDDPIWRGEELRKVLDV